MKKENKLLSPNKPFYQLKLRDKKTEIEKKKFIKSKKKLSSKKILNATMSKHFR